MILSSISQSSRRFKLTTGFVLSRLADCSSSLDGKVFVIVYLGHIIRYCAEENWAIDEDKRQETWEAIRKAEKSGGQYMYCCNFLSLCNHGTGSSTFCRKCEPNFGELWGLELGYEKVISASEAP